MKNTVKRLLFAGVFIISMGAIAPVSFGAGSYDIKEMTPEVKSALDGRKSRFDELRALKSEGAIGENNRGYVEALTSDPQTQTLVNAENQDRELIYQTIESQNNLSNALSTIEKVFAQVQRDKANSGDKIQDESGKWTTK